MNYKIGFIGAGHIASAMINGLVNSGNYLPKDICIYDPDGEKTVKFQAQGFRILSDELAVVNGATYVFLAVRPNILTSVLKKIIPALTIKNVLISVAAGISISYIKRMTRIETKVIRVMPNTPVSIGVGATALAYDMPVTYRELSEVRDMFETVGTVEILPEERMNEVISLNSSSPVYVYMLIHAMIEGAKNQGIDGEIARRMAVQTVLGAAKMIESSDEDISNMIKNICTPNGTTIKAVEYLEKRGFEQAIGDAMLSCTKRAALIEKEIEEN